MRYVLGKNGYNIEKLFERVAAMSYEVKLATEIEARAEQERQFQEGIKNGENFLVKWNSHISYPPVGDPEWTKTTDTYEARVLQSHHQNCQRAQARAYISHSTGKQSRARSVPELVSNLILLIVTRERDQFDWPIRLNLKFNLV